MIERSLPKPGDLVVARRSMRAWVNDRERGLDGLTVDAGDHGLVLQVWLEGRQCRLRLLVKDRMVLFSHALHCVALNWSYGEGCNLGHGPRVFLWAHGGSPIATPAGAWWGTAGSGR